MNAPIALETLDSKPSGGAGAFQASLLKGDKGKPGIALMHGRNSHPDGPVVGFMRRRLHEAGYTTLSIANPLPATGDEFADYVKDLDGPNFVFREAHARIKAGLTTFGAQQLSAAYLLGFSMGARLMSASLGSDSGPLPVRGFIALSLGVNGPGPLNGATTLPKVAVPVLEICGEADADVAKSAPQRRAAYLSGPGRDYQQIVLPGKVPHNLGGSEEEVLKQVVGWIAKAR